MRLLAPLVVLLAATACTQKAPEIDIADPVVIKTPMGGAAYFTIINGGGPDRLIGVVAPRPATRRCTRPSAMARSCACARLTVLISPRAAT